MTSPARAPEEELPLLQQQNGSKSGAAAESEQQLSDKSGIAEASAVDVSSGAENNPAEVSKNDEAEAGGAAKKPEALISLESPGPLSDMERKQKRAERFGVGLKFSEEEKRKLRASRFTGSGKTGVAKAGVLSSSDAEKMNARAARFGTGNKSPVASEDAKKKARAERFSGIDSSAEAEKMKARAARFSNDDAPKKKKLRTDATVVATAQG